MSVSGAAAIAAPASGTMSLLVISSADLASTRATSSATLPLPITATRLHRREIGPLAEIGMAVQPGDELPRAPDERQLLARHAELAVDHHAGGDDHRVVARLQFFPREVAADLDIAGEAHVGLGQQPLELAHDRLGALMIRRHAGTHQAERRRQAIDQVDAQVRAGAQQAVSGIKPRRPRPHDGNPMGHGGVD